MFDLVCIVKPKIFQFLKTHLNKEPKADVSNVMFQKRLALLADTFCHLNNHLQGISSNKRKQRDKIAGLTALAKLKFWKKTETGLVRATF